ncbi:MAG: TolC family protein [Saprospirales bacterium]|nr:TolC family protein [Saprospirales bacterium]
MKPVVASLASLALAFSENRNGANGVSLEEAIARAKSDNLQIKAGTYQIQLQQTLRGAAYDLPKTNFSAQLGQYNSNRFDQGFGIIQEIPNPRNRRAGLAYADANTRAAELSLSVSTNDLTYEVHSAWYELAYLSEKQRLLESQDTLLAGFVKAADARVRTGETNSLEKATAEAQLGESATGWPRLLPTSKSPRCGCKHCSTPLSPVGIPADTRLSQRDFARFDDRSDRQPCFGLFPAANCAPARPRPGWKSAARTRFQYRLPQPDATRWNTMKNPHCLPQTCCSRTPKRHSARATWATSNMPRRSAAPTTSGSATWTRSSATTRQSSVLNGWPGNNSAPASLFFTLSTSF